jgi:hypothetical protein
VFDANEYASFWGTFADVLVDMILSRDIMMVAVLSHHCVMWLVYITLVQLSIGLQSQCDKLEATNPKNGKEKKGIRHWFCTNLGT